MELHNEASIRYYQFLPDGTTNILNKDSNVVSTILKPFYPNKPIIVDYIRRENLPTRVPESRLPFWWIFPFVILYLNR